VNPFAHLRISLAPLPPTSFASWLGVLLDQMTAAYSSGYVASTHGSPGQYLLFVLESTSGADNVAVKEIRAFLEVNKKL
jgi:hypothetical protein